MFQFALALALGAISPAQLAASVSAAAAIEVCFAPEEDCAAFAVRAIDNAEREILVAAYRLTVGSGIVGALIRAKERGVDVRVIADKAAPCGRASGIDPLAAAGVPIWIDDRARLAHAKTMVVDGTVTLMGSYNWTRGASEKSEDLNLVSSPTVAGGLYDALAAAPRRLRPVRSPQGLVPGFIDGGPVMGNARPLTTNPYGLAGSAG